MVDNPHERRHGEAVVNMIAAYSEIMGLLVRLPLPIGIPSLRDTFYTQEVEVGIIRAYKALRDMPAVDEAAKQLLCQMILDWISGTEWMFHDEEEEKGWHLDLVELLIVRIYSDATLVEEILTRESSEE